MIDGRNVAPIWFRTLAWLSGCFALLMSAAPPLAYAGMAPDVSFQILSKAVLFRGLPILAAYLLLLFLALKSDPARRQAVAVILLALSVPISWLLMVHGLR